MWTDTGVCRDALWDVDYHRCGWINTLGYIGGGFEDVVLRMWFEDVVLRMLTLAAGVGTRLPVNKDHNVSSELQNSDRVVCIP
jgi:hypothetical protein